MIRQMLRVAALAMTSLAVVLLTAFAIVGSSQLAEADAVLPPPIRDCGPPHYFLLNICSLGQAKCANFFDCDEFSVDDAAGQPQTYCGCLPAIILVP